MKLLKTTKRTANGDLVTVGKIYTQEHITQMMGMEPSPDTCRSDELYVCTRKPDHKGPHIAFGTKECFQIWTTNA